MIINPFSWPLIHTFKHGRFYFNKICLCLNIIINIIPIKEIPKQTNGNMKFMESLVFGFGDGGVSGGQVVEVPR